MATKKTAGTARSGFTTKSVRFPAETWLRLGDQAKKHGVSRQTLLRELVTAFLRKAA